MKAEPKVVVWMPFNGREGTGASVTLDEHGNQTGTLRFYDPNVERPWEKKNPSGLEATESNSSTENSA